MVTANHLLDEIITLTCIVFMLGLRHGFELDHLAVIDGMICSTPSLSKLTKWIGLLFSLGHGLVIVLLTSFIAFEAIHWSVPVWMESVGLWISISFLVFFGCYSLYQTCKKQPRESGKILGPKSYLFNKWGMNQANGSFLTPVCVGMLFSLSFDTLTITTAFSLNGYAMGGAILAILLGVIFMMGMMITDGLNGFFIAKILDRSDKRSRYLSRALDLGIGAFSLLLGGSYLVSYFSQ
ncbi:DNA repair protein [Legionella taurinensis]|uniref:Nickel/cobalt efflux system n=1 Tax=Legionella taurinensis TaxID=70611 RepID=A0AB38N3R1_9GAMM|nr:DNA repair protein [Legionella taurinensis]MDX1837268.1 DNA repair protein [Legionella taurinensis]PUT40260.1 DNA repair protein [Legionella taurinensis]PUT41494.1 DNA repair protein [Legionella taurinensis]PUT44360.1 DNA repair protein [Legionella taurinensis]PUT48322.1 DNA repair protein [Legionella taurinensis]